MLGRNKRECTKNLVAITAEITRQVSVAAGSLWNDVQPLPATVYNENNVLDTAAPPAHVNRKESTMTTYYTISNATRAYAAYRTQVLGS